MPRVNLPFQIIETINESRATRETKKRPQLTLFDVYEGKEGDTFEEGWKNKLIWGDNLLVTGALLEKFAGKVDLIYIDPPFATGADFRTKFKIGENGLRIAKMGEIPDLEKEASAIEEKVYRDTWGRGMETYLEMLSSRLRVARDLLSENGSLYLHLDPTVSHYAKLMLDEVFGAGNFKNEVIWCYKERERILNFYNPKHDVILFFSKSDSSNRPFNWKDACEEYSEVTLAKFKYVDEKGHYQIRGTNTQGSPIRAADGLTPEHELKYPGLTYRDYLEDRPGVAPRDWWTIPIINKAADERLDYATQKPESLLERIVKVSSKQGNLVADIFCGSGTTLAVAEKLGRRWIGCDLSRWAIHVTRKRLLGIEGCKPFEVLNLGKYERKYWQGITFGRKTDEQQIAIFQYIAFILKLYGAEPLSGMQHIHGKKGKAMIHIGAVDAPVTIDEINACIQECQAIKQNELHILGWEWEMGLSNVMVEEAKRRGIKLLLLNIPREVMEQQAVDKGDIRFFEVAYLNAEIKQEKGKAVKVALKEFAFPYADLIPEDVRKKIKKWSDYIDYWAVDWDFQNDTFMNGWVAYRTRKDRSLVLHSDSHSYDKTGRYTIMVKVVDIFGNDTSQTFEVEVK
ncbi:MAG: site-specific DNA-methyltransferase [Thermodesulfobacteriota bacterium]